MEIRYFSKQIKVCTIHKNTGGVRGGNSIGIIMPLHCNFYQHKCGVLQRYHAEPCSAFLMSRDNTELHRGALLNT